MGRVVSAVTRLFFKLKGLDVFPWRWSQHPEDRWQGLLGELTATSKECLRVPCLACPPASALLQVRAEAEELFVCKDKSQNSDLAHKPVAACFYLLPDICMH